MNDVLQDLGASEKPRITALNKIDLLDDPAQLDTTLYPNAVPVSALRKVGLDALGEKIAQVLAQRMVIVRVKIPFTRSELVELFYRRGHVEREDYQPDGTVLVGRIPRSLNGYYAPYTV